MKTKRHNKLLILFILFFVVSFFTNLTYATTENLKLYSEAAIIIENKTGKTLFEKNSEQKMYPASTTKILTAILTLEKGNLTDKTTVTKSAISEMKEGYTSAYLVEGEILTIEELLELLLVHSANDASNVLAEYISGSIPAFVDLMNLKLKELGCNNSHFVTTNGLHDDNHYTTAKDMATITRYCMKNADFRRIVAMQNCHIKATNKFGERIFKNTNALEVSDSKYYYPGCIGIKTGFTSQAQNCLISAVNRNNLQLIAVVLHCNLTDDKKSARYVDSKTLYDYAYSNYSFKEIAKASTVVKTIEINGGTKESRFLDLKLQDNITALVKNDSLINAIPEIKLKENLSAPISQNSVIGQATYTIDGQTYSTNLLASHTVEKNESMILYFKVALGIVFFSLFIILVTSLIKALKPNTRKEEEQELEVNNDESQKSKESININDESKEKIINEGLDQITDFNKETKENESKKAINEEKDLTNNENNETIKNEQVTLKEETSIDDTKKNKNEINAEKNKKSKKTKIKK